MATIGASEVIRTRTTPPWRYAIGMFGTSIPINMIKGSVLLFYVDILGLDIGFYAGVMVVYAIIDALDNPAFGYLSDRTRTRFGRRKPWLIIGAPLLAIGLVAYFSPPAGLTGISLVVWYAIFAIMSEMVDSMINANYGALLPELFPLEKARAKANSLRQGFQLIALVISLALTPLLTTSIFGTSKTTQGFTTTAIIYAILGAGVILLMGTWIHEPPLTPRPPSRSCGRRSRRSSPTSGSGRSASPTPATAQVWRSYWPASSCTSSTRSGSRSPGPRCWRRR